MINKSLNVNNNKVKILLSIGSFAVATILLFLLFVLPMTNRVRNMRARILENQMTIDAQAKQIAEFEAAEKKLVQIRHSLDSVSSLFPKREEAVVLVEALESAVSGSQVTESTLKITDAAEAAFGNTRGGQAAANVHGSTLKNIEEVPFVLSTNGTYRNFTDLMLYMENSPFIIEVRDLDFRAEATQVEGGGINKTGFADGIFKGLFFLNQVNQDNQETTPVEVDNTF